MNRRPSRVAKEEVLRNESSVQAAGLREDQSGTIPGARPTRLPGPDEALMKGIERAELLGLSFDAVTMETAVARCLEPCRGPRTSHTVITANASQLCRM